MAESVAAAPAVPTADSLSDKSFEHLQAKRYKEALEAGLEALKLDPKHAHAQYNVGMAYLELGEPCRALAPLEQTAAQQPERYEPQLALSRAYTATFSATRGAYHAAVAERLGAPNGARTATDELGGLKAPADLEKASRAMLEDGNVTLYLYPEAGKQGCNGKVFSLYAVTKDGQSAGLLLGSLREGDTLKLTRAEPGRYWLKSPPLYTVYVSPSYNWRLFSFQDGRLSMTLFGGSDSVESEDPPIIEGQTVSAARQNTASGATTKVTRYTLGGNPVVGTVSDEETQAFGGVKAIGDTIAIRIAPEGRPGITQEALNYSRPLTGKVQVLKGGKPVPLSDVKIGSLVLVRDSKQQGLIIELR
ncbi:MAG TPA: hypothetical protein VNT75_11145 [Symbiobacteriaceae bacterium]|nr:hypothetical protein [Symbiobacteriaceae bacterium]